MESLPAASVHAKGGEPATPPGGSQRSMVGRTTSLVSQAIRTVTGPLKTSYQCMANLVGGAPDSDDTNASSARKSWLIDNTWKGAKLAGNGLRIAAIGTVSAIRYSAPSIYATARYVGQTGFHISKATYKSTKKVESAFRDEFVRVLRDECKWDTERISERARDISGSFTSIFGLGEHLGDRSTDVNHGSVVYGPSELADRGEEVPATLPAPSKKD